MRRNNKNAGRPTPTAAAYETGTANIAQIGIAMASAFGESIPNDEVSPQAVMVMPNRIGGIRGTSKNAATIRFT